MKLLGFDPSPGKNQAEAGRQAQHERVHASLVVVVFMSLHAYQESRRPSTQIN
jgi:hypothetical protein